MKKIILTTALFVLITNLSIAETRIPTADFTNIRVANAFNIVLVPSDRNEVVFPQCFEFPVVQPRSLRPQVELTAQDIVSVRGNTLTIAYSETHQSLHPVRRNANERGTIRHEIIVYFKSLESLTASGASRVLLREEIVGEQLRLQTSGASVVTLQVSHDQISATASGASNLTLSGNANTFNFTASGASTVNAGNLETQRANINISGASNATVHTSTATGSASGASNLRLNSDAQHSVTTSGTSTINSETRTIAENGEQVHAPVLDIRLFPTAPPTPRRSRFLSPRYAGFDFGFGGFGQDFFRTTLPEGYENMELRLHQSFVINVNLFDYGIRFGQSNFSAGAGLGIGWNIFRFQEHNMIPSMDRENRQFTINPFAGEEDRVYRKSNLRSSWLRIPVFLQYGDRNFAVLAGVVGNVRLGASAKQVYTFPDSSRRQRFVSRDDFYLQGFRLDTEIRITRRNFGIFASYSLTEMFLNNRGPELNAFSFGATLVF